MDRREMFTYLEKNKDKVKEIDQKFLEAHCANINEVFYNWEIKTSALTLQIYGLFSLRANFPSFFFVSS